MGILATPPKSYIPTKNNGLIKGFGVDRVGDRFFSDVFQMGLRGIEMSSHSNWNEMRCPGRTTTIHTRGISGSFALQIQTCDQPNLFRIKSVPEPRFYGWCDLYQIMRNNRWYLLQNIIYSSTYFTFRNTTILQGNVLVFCSVFVRGLLFSLVGYRKSPWP